MSSDAFYREEILDHYKHPRHKGHLDDPDIHYHDHNPFCGDEITVELKVEDGIIVECAFDGHGCAISQATACMLMEEILGRPLAEVRDAGQGGHPRPARHRDRPGTPQVRPPAAEGAQGGRVWIGGMAGVSGWKSEVGSQNERGLL